MTIDNTLHCLRVMVDEENCENCPCYGETGTDHCEKDAVRVAIASLEAWEKVRTELSEYGSICVMYTIKGTTPQDIEDIVDDVVGRAKKQMLAIIDKHIKEVEYD